MVKTPIIGATLLVLAGCGSGGGDASREDVVQAMAEMMALEQDATEGCFGLTFFGGRDAFVELFLSLQPDETDEVVDVVDFEFTDEELVILDEHGVTRADFESLYEDDGSISRDGAEIMADALMLPCLTSEGDDAND